MACCSRLRQAVVLAAAALSMVVQGCASYGGETNPSWFPRTAAEVRAPGRVALIVAPEVQVYLSPIGQSSKLQVGQILAQAMQGALEAGLQDGVKRLAAPRPAVGAYSAT